MLQYMQTKTNNQIDKEIMEVIKHYSKLLNMKESVKFKTVKGEGFNGKYYSFNHRISLNKTIYKTWDKKRRVWEFLIVHELVHAKYKDLQKEGITSTWSPKIALKNAFKELRANTIAYQLTNYTSEELEYYFKEIYSYGDSISAVTGGYLKGEEYINFILEYPEWNRETIEAAGKYFRTYGNWWNYFRRTFEKNYLEVKEGFLLAENSSFALVNPYCKY